MTALVISATCGTMAIKAIAISATGWTHAVIGTATTTGGILAGHAGEAIGIAIAIGPGIITGTCASAVKT